MKRGGKNDSPRRQADLELVNEALDLIYDTLHGLNEWEQEFIPDLEEWLEDNEILTTSQRSKLNEILEDNA